MAQRVTNREVLETLLIVKQNNEHILERVEKIEGHLRQLNGSLAEHATRLALLEQKEKGHSVNWDRVWAILQAVIIGILTLILTGIIKV